MDTTFDSKYAGREIRALAEDLIEEHGGARGAKQEAARMLGINKPVFNQLLYGHQQGVSFKTVSAVCDKLGVSVDDFMADTSYARSARKGHRGA